MKIWRKEKSTTYHPDGKKTKGFNYYFCGIFVWFKVDNSQ